MDPRVRYIRQANGGVTKARNTGMENSRGEFIAFLDSDDLWLPWKLECQIEILNHFPNAGMLWTDMEAVDQHGKRLHPSYLTKMYSAYAYFDRDVHFKQQAFVGDLWIGCPAALAERKCFAGNIFDRMFLGNLVHTSTVLLKRERQNLVGKFNEQLIVSGEDYDFHLRTCQIGEVAYIDVSSIQYRIGANDQLTAPGHRIWLARNDLKTITSVLEKKVPLSLSRSMVRKRLAESNAWIGIEEFYEDHRSCRRHLFRSLCLNPFQKRAALFFILSFVPMQIITVMRQWKQRLSLPLL
jgi:glycosyltransferase involved in cell wall biosynthesis